MNLGALIVLPFLAWAFYRVIRALRTGVFESFVASPRTSDPVGFWLGIATETMLAFVLGGVFVAIFLRTGTGWLLWLAGTFLAAYVILCLVLTRVFQSRRGS